MLLLLFHLLSAVAVVGFAVKSYDDSTDDMSDMVGIVVASIVPVISQIMLVIIILGTASEYYDTRKNNHIIYNKIYKCSSCGLYSRKGYMHLHKLNTGKDGYPNCESERTMNSTNLDINTELPLSPKFTAKQIKELEKMESDKEKNELIDDQLEKYLALQEKKLSKTYDEALSKLNELKQNKL